MSRRKPLKSLSDWIGAGGHSFDGSLLKSDEDGAIRRLELDRIVAGRYHWNAASASSASSSRWWSGRWRMAALRFWPATCAGGRRNRPV